MKLVIKRCVSLGIMMFALIFIIPVTSFAETENVNDLNEVSAEGTCGEKLAWKLEDNTLTISGQGTMEDYTSATRPDWYSYRWNIYNIVVEAGVTSIGNYAFQECKWLESISVSNTVSHIGKGAFSHCETLKQFEIPNGVTYVGAEAFGYCINLESIIIPDSVEELGSFRGCENLKEIKLSSNISEICDYMFYGCKNLVSIDIPEEVIKIGMYAFYDCDSLESVNVPESVSFIGSSAFRHCDNLKVVKMPINIEEIKSGMFAFCKNLTTINLPSKVKNIGEDAFEECTALQTIEIPDQVLIIEANAFLKCSLLKEVILPEGIVEIEDGVFDKCSQRLKLYYKGNACKWDKIYMLSDDREALSKIVVLEKGDHPWDEGTITVVPTQNYRGIMAYECLNCGATKKEEFITDMYSKRISGKTRYQTSLNIADELKATLEISKFDTIIIASGTDFPDALSGSYLATKKNAPILLVNSNPNYISMVQNYIADNLHDDGKIYILGGTAAVEESIETELVERGYNVKRLAGKTRYETNLAILEEAGAGKGDKEILICTGTGFADSLSASSTGKPILLVGNTLTNAQRTFIIRANHYRPISQPTFYIIGGEAVVNKNIASYVSGLCSNRVLRISGKNRYITSKLVAQTFCVDSNKVVVASATSFPDGLCGGPLAYAMESSLLLTGTTYQPTAEFVSENAINSGYILGGENALSNDIIDSIFSAN